MLPTPSTSHVSFDTIYEPAEDSFLLLDTLSNPQQATWLAHRFREKKVPLAVEVGTGSGVVLSFLAANAETIIGKSIVALGIDVNNDACLATAQTVTQAVRDQNSKSVYLSSICSDLGGAVRPRSIDILIFNPPYVPSEELPALPHLHVARDKFDRESHLLSLSYAGGQDGMETTERLLGEIPTLLSRRGVAYVLLCAQNKPDKVKDGIRDWPGGRWKADTVGTSGKVAGWEKLQIIRIWR